MGGTGGLDSSRVSEEIRSAESFNGKKIFTLEKFPTFSRKPVQALSV
jgi:hypothetical protein